MKAYDIVTAFAPASVANVIVGFDILGFAIPNFGDKVTLKKITKGIKITEITGIKSQIPLDPYQNTAGFTLLKLIEAKNLPFGFEIKIEKGIPIGSGLGGSAASAVAAIVAANEFLEPKLSIEEQFEFALLGETIASGGMHADNVAPCLYGGLVQSLNLGKEDGKYQFRIKSIPFPNSLYIIIVQPHFKLETKNARSILSETISRTSFTKQSMYLCGFLTACYTSDIELLEESLNDIVIEPQRKHLIPNFDEIQSIALNNGSMGFSISGAGPSMFGFCKNKTDAKNIELKLGKANFNVDLTISITQISDKGSSIKEMS